jgi:hypothetical protein
MSCEGCLAKEEASWLDQNPNFANGWLLPQITGTDQLRATLPIANCSLELLMI